MASQHAIPLAATSSQASSGSPLPVASTNAGSPQSSGQPASTVLSATAAPSNAGSQTPASTTSHQQTQTGSPALSSTHSPFSFRDKRDTWIAAAGLIITILAVPGLVYAVKSYEVSNWTSEKDFWEHCQAQKEASKNLSKQCLAIVDKDLPPPPYHDAGFFVELERFAKRALRNERHDNRTINTWDLSRWLMLIFSTYFFREGFVYTKKPPPGTFQAGEEDGSLVVFVRSGQMRVIARNPALMILVHLLVRVALRCFSVFLWLLPQWTLLQAIAWAVRMSSWVLLNGYIYYGLFHVERSMGAYTTETIAYCAIFGHYNGMMSDDYTTVGGLLLRVASFFCSFCFVGTLRHQWPGSLRWNELRKLAKGREFSFGVAMVGISLALTSGILFLRDDAMGCSFMGVQGPFVPWGQMEVPMLQSMHVPITLTFLVWAICAYVDDYRHERGSFKPLLKTT